MPFTNAFFSSSPGRPTRAPMAPEGPRNPTISRANAATPSLDPQSLAAQRLNLTPEQLANPQFMAMFQNFLAQLQRGPRSGFSGSLVGVPTQTKV